MNKKGMSNDEAERKARMERARKAAADRLSARKPGEMDTPAAPKAAVPSAAAPVSGKKYTVQAGDSLGALALKFYGSAAKDQWMKIYEANKAVIGDNPNMIKAGQELIIPDKD